MSHMRSYIIFLVILFAFPRSYQSVFAVDMVPSFVGMSNQSTSLDEGYLPDAISVARSRPLGLLTGFSDEDLNASKVDNNVGRVTN